MFVWSLQCQTEGRGVTLKEYLNRLCAVLVRLQTQDEEMVVVAFVQEMTASPFNDSLIRNRVETLFEVREWSIAPIKAEEAVLMKKGSSRLKQPRNKENKQDGSARSSEVSIEKITD